MNEFLQQFVIESREIAEATGEGLLLLERSPQDPERLDAVFRGFHTLKGGAGIVDFSAMERAVHGAETILSEARAGKQLLTPARVGQCLACVDQVLQWLDTIEQTGQLPKNAAYQADLLISRFEATTSDSSGAQDRTRDHVSSSWLQHTLKERADLHGRATTAVRFVPAADAFYQGQDPLQRMTSLPGLLALDCAPGRPWEALDQFDPFDCNLVLTALSAAPTADVAAHLQEHAQECEIVAVTAGEMGGSLHSLPPHVAEVIKAQEALLKETTADAFFGFVSSAGLTAANALRSCGRSEQAEVLSGATEESLATLSTEPLARAVAQLFVAKTVPTTEVLPESGHAVDAIARTLRIDADRVDALVRLAGELTAAVNAIGHVTKLAQAGDPVVPALLKDGQAALERLIGELQSSVLGLRVLPLRVVLQRFPRIVREMSAALNKPVKLVIEGNDTEADKAIIEMLFEPLLHIVRNAIDHGIENEQTRVARGKPRVATVRIKALRQLDQVMIEISDDGSGIDIARVRQVAQARGVVAQDVLDTMSEADIVELIFAPGFSTASEVTQLSGRGVGMDAVRKAVERTGGKVSIASRAGQGTCVTLSLPFSVMVTHVMTVEAGGQMFGVPLEGIIETVRVPRASISGVGAAQAIVLRNRTLPVIDLATRLGAERPGPDNDLEATLVVAVAGGEWAGFRVDRVVERLGLILKPLEGLLAGTPGIIGTTLLGDGRVLLVLDIGELLQ